MMAWKNTQKDTKSKAANAASPTAVDGAQSSQIGFSIMSNALRRDRHSANPSVDDMSKFNASQTLFRAVAGLEVLPRISLINLSSFLRYILYTAACVSDIAANGVIEDKTF